MIKVLGLIALCLVLTACSRGQEYPSQSLVLCSLDKKEGYVSSPGAGDTSFLKREKAIDEVCKK